MKHKLLHSNVSIFLLHHSNWKRDILFELFTFDFWGGI